MWQDLRQHVSFRSHVWTAPSVIDKSKDPGSILRTHCFVTALSFRSADIVETNGIQTERRIHCFVMLGTCISKRLFRRKVKTIVVMTHVSMIQIVTPCSAYTIVKICCVARTAICPCSIYTLWCPCTCAICSMFDLSQALTMSM